ncbi:hypothetical protein [Kineosporia sp. R_H_3]|uniref:hypothetical protein n=1 Tax=Kineosporia sp. R_H_3 TaxID=1961848 RepID=UPI000B4C0199|nr:hypothetical protein [Kineosporia sp. R_H_3]
MSDLGESSSGPRRPLSAEEREEADGAWALIVAAVLAVSFAGAAWWASGRPLVALFVAVGAFCALWLLMAFTPPDPGDVAAPLPRGRTVVLIGAGLGFGAAGLLGSVVTPWLGLGLAVVVGAPLGALLGGVVAKALLVLRRLGRALVGGR